MVSSTTVSNWAHDLAAPLGRTSEKLQLPSRAHLDLSAAMAAWLHGISTAKSLSDVGASGRPPPHGFTRGIPPLS
jgi:hypothetical protein